eukprot:TRINITY_DN7761_c0_g1_i1.p2 TRINITY_DN7761_c0_g1~~TRINITY_DN7761_c0_g1_i1.p2  ORF type:complete len:127 (+),score=12.71 TRINITY_DN7761_c0_g1_i1:238-618(+)
MPPNLKLWVGLLYNVRDDDLMIPLLMGDAKKFLQLKILVIQSLVLFMSLFCFMLVSLFLSCVDLIPFSMNFMTTVTNFIHVKEGACIMDFLDQRATRDSLHFGIFPQFSDCPCNLSHYCVHFVFTY